MPTALPHQLPAFFTPPSRGERRGQDPEARTLEAAGRTSGAEGKGWVRPQEVGRVSAVGCYVAGAAADAGVGTWPWVMWPWVMVRSSRMTSWRHTTTW